MLANARKITIWMENGTETLVVAVLQRLARRARWPRVNFDHLKKMDLKPLLDKLSDEPIRIEAAKPEIFIDSELTGRFYKHMPCVHPYTVVMIEGYLIDVPLGLAQGASCVVLAGPVRGQQLEQWPCAIRRLIVLGGSDPLPVINAAQAEKIASLYGRVVFDNVSDTTIERLHKDNPKPL